MKLKFILTVFCCFFFVLIHAQEVEMEQDTLRVKALKAHQLPAEQYNAWKRVEESWRSEYVKILKEQKLSMSCKGCQAVQMDVILTIDATGKLKHYRLLKSNKCSEPFPKALELRFMKYFFGLQFPKELNNLNVEVHLGTGLKC